MELVVNGFFDSGELEPWTPCGGTPLAGGAVSDNNPVFVSEFNLRLIGNDCVRQLLARAAIVSSGAMSLWLRWYPRGLWEHLSAAEVGTFEARVEYAEGGEGAVAMMNRDALFARGPRFLDPCHMTVAIDPLRCVTGVSLRCYGAVEPWYVSAVSMDGYHVGGWQRHAVPRLPGPRDGSPRAPGASPRQDRTMAGALAQPETQATGEVAAFLALTATARPVVTLAPLPQLRDCGAVPARSPRTTAARPCGSRRA